MQHSLPAGGLRLCRAGVEPAGSRCKVSAHSHPPCQGFPWRTETASGRQYHPRDGPQVRRGTVDAGRGLRGYRRCPLSNAASVATGQGTRRSTDDPCVQDCAAGDRHLPSEHASVNGVQSASKPRATQRDAPKASIPTGGRLHARVDRDYTSGRRLRSGNSGIQGSRRRPTVRHPGQSSAAAVTRQQGRDRPPPVPGPRRFRSKCGFGLPWGSPMPRAALRLHRQTTRESGSITRALWLVSEPFHARISFQCDTLTQLDSRRNSSEDQGTQIACEPRPQPANC